MDDDNIQNIPTQDEHDKELDEDDTVYHPDQVSRLAEDGTTPAADPDDVPRSHISKDYPTTDSEVDEQERYDQGLGAASGTTDTVEDSDDVEEVVDTY